MTTENTSLSWSQTFSALLHPRVITMLFLGLSAGLPILLIFSSLSLWLREAGVERAAVTFFSWAALGYSFKFVWAPLVDRLPVPILTRVLGRRRSWILLAQGAIIVAIVWMAMTDPASGQASLTMMALAAVMLGFSSATQDIVIDAYRIECAEPDLQALLSATYIAGYRVGMLIAGAGAIFLAEYLGSETEAYLYSAWKMSYLCMAGVMLVGVLTTLLIPEPSVTRETDSNYQIRDYLGFLLIFALGACFFILTFLFSAEWVQTIKSQVSAQFGNRHVVGFLVETVRLLLALAAAGLASYLLLLTGIVNRNLVSGAYVDPVRDFFRRYGAGVAWLLLALVGLYRISDIVLGVISNVFYQDLGFSKTDIATAVKTFGLVMTLVGGFVGGIFAVRYGVMRMLFTGAVLTVLTNLLFILLAHAGDNLILLYAVISADNLTAGLASAAFIAFLSSLTNIRFTAVQYAIFSSLMTLVPKIIGGYSGTMVDAVGYSQFFLIASLMGVPVLLLVWLAGRHLDLRTPDSAEESTH